jgi:hypothetical protein
MGSLRGIRIPQSVPVGWVVRCGSLPRRSPPRRAPSMGSLRGTRIPQCAPASRVVRCGSVPLRSPPACALHGVVARNSHSAVRLPPAGSFAAAALRCVPPRRAPSMGSLRGTRIPRSAPRWPGRALRQASAASPPACAPHGVVARNSHSTVRPCQPGLVVDCLDKPAPAHNRASSLQRGWSSFQCRQWPRSGCRLTRARRRRSGTARSAAAPPALPPGCMTSLRRVSHSSSSSLPEECRPPATQGHSLPSPTQASSCRGLRRQSPHCGKPGPPGQSDGEGCDEEHFPLGGERGLLVHLTPDHPTGASKTAWGWCLTLNYQFRPTFVVGAPTRRSWNRIFRMWRPPTAPRP